jgi:FtsZ-interacting cell division protein ZipA
LGLNKASEVVSDLLDEAKLNATLVNEPATAHTPIEEFNEIAVIVLKSEHLFNGKVAWDALQCLGLTWGDGDLFHWKNETTVTGDVLLFFVYTSTEPGYFLPERVFEGGIGGKMVKE